LFGLAYFLSFRTTISATVSTDSSAQVRYPIVGETPGISVSSKRIADLSVARFYVIFVKQAGQTDFTLIFFPSIRLRHLAAGIGDNLGFSYASGLESSLASCVISLVQFRFAIARNTGCPTYPGPLQLLLHKLSFPKTMKSKFVLRLEAERQAPAERSTRITVNADFARSAARPGSAPTYLLQPQYLKAPVKVHQS
jgi:hypothetical protein